MITLFAIPKSFSDPHIAVVQTNAILSWRRLLPETDILIFGNGPGINEFCQKNNLCHVTTVKTNSYGTPLMNDVFAQARTLARQKILMYVNSDIILLPDLLTAVPRLTNQPQFLAVGRRTDLSLQELLQLTPDYEDRLREQIKLGGALHGYSGIDYLLFPQNLSLDLPPFAIGRPGWDNSLIYRCRQRQIPVIDTTAVITAIHQNHHYGHHPQGQRGVFDGSEAQENLRLAGGLARLMSIRGADWQLTESGLRRATLTNRLYSGLQMFYPTAQLLALKRICQRKLNNNFLFRIFYFLFISYLLFLI